MDLIKIFTVLGWMFAITPLVIFVVISAYVIKGAMGDDDLIKALVMIGVGIFFIGVTMLVLLYLTNIFESGSFVMLSYS